MKSAHYNGMYFLAGWLMGSMVMAIIIFVLFIFGGVDKNLIGIARKPKPTSDGDKITEQVREVWYRTELRHAGCPKDGYWRIDSSKQSTKVEVYAENGYMYPHKCSGCDLESEIFNVRYPQIKREWEVVK